MKHDEVKFETILWVVFGLCLFVVLIWNSATKAIDETEPTPYTEFTNLYRTCHRINKDLCILREKSQNDPEFKDYSKSLRINSLKNELVVWVNAYNEQAEEIPKAEWSSNQLPYKINLNQFSCY